jgi:hypothetical protein
MANGGNAGGKKERAAEAVEDAERKDEVPQL